MTTPVQLINLAFRNANVLGVGQTASAEDMNDAFRMLNMMLAQWNRRRYLIYHLTNITFQATSQISYTIGPGGDINTVRPYKIESAFFRQQSVNPNVDYPLEILNSREDYNRIALKSINSFPSALFYDSGWPLGRVYLWPIPNNQYTVTLSVMDQLQPFSTLFDDVNLPPEYEEVIVYNLALRLFPMYGLTPTPAIVKAAEVSMNTIEAANAQIPRLRIPRDLVSNGLYNIFSDQVN